MSAKPFRNREGQEPPDRDTGLTGGSWRNVWPEEYPGQLRRLGPDALLDAAPAPRHRTGVAFRRLRTEASLSPASPRAAPRVRRNALALAVVRSATASSPNGRATIGRVYCTWRARQATPRKTGCMCATAQGLNAPNSRTTRPVKS